MFLMMSKAGMCVSACSSFFGLYRAYEKVKQFPYGFDRIDKKQ